MKSKKPAYDVEVCYQPPRFLYAGPNAYQALSNPRNDGPNMNPAPKPINWMKSNEK